MSRASAGPAPSSASSPVWTLAQLMAMPNHPTFGAAESTEEDVLHAYMMGLVMLWEADKATAHDPPAGPPRPPPAGGSSPL